MLQFLITPAAGKRLIGKAVAAHPAVQSALQNGTLVIVAGTTNGYAVEEILSAGKTGVVFTRRRFFRGITPAPGFATTESGRLPDESEFPGDAVFIKGEWRQGATIFDVADSLQEGDVILKGVNAANVETGQAAVYIGHPKAGTIGAALQAVAGRRVRLILPVGLEKRVFGDLNSIARRINAPGSKGPRLLPICGEILTELQAVSLLTGAHAQLIAAGGVCGAEGAVWLGVEGTEDEMRKVETVMQSVSQEPLMRI